MTVSNRLARSSRAMTVFLWLLESVTKRHMTAPEAASQIPTSAAPRASWREGLAVYLQRRVLIVLLLGF